MPYIPQQDIGDNPPKTAGEAAAQQAANTKARDDATAGAAAAAQQQAAAQAAAAANAHFQYGGYANGANDASARYAGLGAAAQGRAAPQIDYGVANDDHNRNVLTSYNQNSMAGLLAARANGSMPLISQMQADRQMQQAAAEQSSAAASARGPAGLALAQQGAAANTAAMQSNISNHAQIAGAQEQMGNAVAAGQAYTGIRAGDQALQGQDAAQATAQGQMNLAQHGLNDQYQLGMTGYETGVQQAQLGAQGNQVAIAAGQQQARAALAQNQNQYDSSRTDKYIGMGLGAAGTAAGVAAALFSGGGDKTAATNGAGIDSGFGAPGATAGGYSAETGAPQAGTGGGYDPDHPGSTSDVTAKQNIRPVDPIGLRDGSQSVGPERRVISFSRDGRDGHGLNVRTTHEPIPRDTVTFSRDNNQGQASNVVTTHDPTTAQLANGLAPSTYDYKPGYGTAGEKFGPMAQNMAANPATATAVRSDPAQGGLMSIDNADGLKVALGGVGHLAQKQAENEAEIQHLKGLLAQPQPSIGQRFMNIVRGGR